MVRAVGIEPTLLSELDFESSASTSFTTPAETLTLARPPIFANGKAPLIRAASGGKGYLAFRAAAGLPFAAGFGLGLRTFIADASSTFLMCEA